MNAEKIAVFITKSVIRLALILMGLGFICMIPIVPVGSKVFFTIAVTLILLAPVAIALVMAVVFLRRSERTMSAVSIMLFLLLIVSVVQKIL